MKEKIAWFLLIISSKLPAWVNDLLRKVFAFFYRPGLLCSICRVRWAYAGSNLNEVQAGYGSEHDTSTFKWRLFCPPTGSICDNCINWYIVNDMLIETHNCVGEGCGCVFEKEFAGAGFHQYSQESFDREAEFCSAVEALALAESQDAIVSLCDRLLAIDSYPHTDDLLVASAEDEPRLKVLVSIASEIYDHMRSGQYELAQAKAAIFLLVHKTIDQQDTINRLQNPPPPRPYSDMLLDFI